MMRRLIAVLTLVLLCPTAGAQELAMEVDQLREKIDSLTVLRSQLQRQLDTVIEELDNTEALLQLRRMDDVGPENVALFTNMEASLRSQPAPDGRVIRILPENTPLVAVDYNGAYWKVRYQGIEGWIMRLFLDEGEGATELKEKLKTAHAGGDGEIFSNRRTSDQERIGKKFLITDFGVHPPNSAGGISIYYAFEHLDSTRTIREVTFSITPYNTDGLKEKGLNSGASTKRLRRFGPISVHDGEKQYQFENVWYNDKIACAEIDRVDIVYTDGSRRSHQHDMADILAGAIENDCTTAPEAVEESPENDE